MYKTLLSSDARRFLTGAALLVALLTSCSLVSSRRAMRQTTSTPEPTAEPQAATNQNGSKRCKARNYIFSDVRNDPAQSECYRLQRQLLEAAARNDLKTMKEALMHGAHPDGIIDDGYTALHAAAAGGSVDVVRMLLDNGADVNWGDFISGTPLIMAANSGHDEIVNILLAKGAKVCIKADGGTALDGARRQGHQKVVDLLLSAGADKCK